MTDDSIEAKALALLNEVGEERMGLLAGHINREITPHEALCRAIEQHEAFKQDVSDVLLEYYGGYHNASGEPLERFIIPKPDPLLDVMGDLGWDYDVSIDYAKDLRAALEARGLEIRSKGQ